MADVIIVTPQPIICSTSPNPTLQDIRTAIDISAWDRIDLQVGMLSSAGTFGSVLVEIFTSMQNLVDDASWYSGGVMCGSVSFTAAGPANSWKALPLPAAGSALLRYMRYRITLTTVTNATIMISGMGRRL